MTGIPVDLYKKRDGHWIWRGYDLIQASVYGWVARKQGVEIATAVTLEKLVEKLRDLRDAA